MLIVPYPLTDTSQHAALWEGAPTFREGEELMEAVVGLCEAKRGGEEINACQASSIREAFVFRSEIQLC